MTKTALILVIVALLPGCAKDESSALARPVKSTYSGTPWRSLTGYDLETSRATFSPDGRLLAAIGQSNMLVTMKENGRTLKLEGSDYTVKIWSTSTWKLSRTLRLTTLIGDLSFSPNGKLLGVIAGTTVTIYKTADGKIDRTLGAQSNGGPIAFSPQGDVLCVGNKLIDTRTWKPLHSLPTADSVNSVAFAPDGKTIATGSWDGVVQVWDVATGKQKKTVHRAVDYVDVVFSPDGKMLSTSCWRDEAVQLWDTSSWQQLRSLIAGKTTDSVSGVDSVDFSPDNKNLVTASDLGMKLWDIATGQVIHTFHGESARLSAHSVEFSPDGGVIASASRAATVDLWNVPHN